MKASELVVGNFYTLSGLPSEKLRYQGLVPEQMETYVGDHIFMNVEIYGRIPGCVLNTTQVEELIHENDAPDHGIIGFSLGEH